MPDLTREPVALLVGSVAVLSVLGVLLLDALGWWDLEQHQMLVVAFVIACVAVLLVAIVRSSVTPYSRSPKPPEEPDA